MEQYEYRNGPPAPRMVAELAMRHDALVKQLADAQATIAALEQRVKELKQWVQDQSTANLETMRHMDEMQSRAMDAESQLTQRTAELARVRDQYADLRKMVLALPKVEGEITCSQQFDSAWRLHYWQVEAYGVADECLYRLSNLREEEAKAYAALLKHRQGME